MAEREREDSELKPGPLHKKNGLIKPNVGISCSKHTS